MTQKALDTAEQILDEELDRADVFTFGPVLRAKTSVITTVLSTQAKVDETRLRRQNFDRLPELLRLVNETQGKLPVTIDG